MRKVDAEDFDIKIGEEDTSVGITEGVATHKGVSVYFSIIKVMDDKAVHFDNPDVMRSLGVSETELEREILDAYDRGE